MTTVDGSDGPEFSGPSIGDFFPPAIFFEGNEFFQIDRIMLLRLVIAGLLILMFWLGTRRMSIVPGRFQGTIEMAHTLGKVVVAEGIEDDLTAERLRRLGCDIGQGFLFSPAVAMDELLVMLEEKYSVACA